MFYKWFYKSDQFLCFEFFVSAFSKNRFFLCKKIFFVINREREIEKLIQKAVKIQILIYSVTA